MAHDKVKHLNVKLANRLNFEISDCWLRSTRVARESGQLQEAYSFLLEVRKSKHVELFLETAKLDWARDNHTGAISALKKGLCDAFPHVEAALLEEPTEGKKNHPALTSALEVLSNDEKDVLCQGKLLMARYMEEASNVSNETISKMYKDVKSITTNNEDVYFENAKSIDKQIRKSSDDLPLAHGDPIAMACILYLRSMTIGPTHLHHCLPRMLSLWLDYAENYATTMNLKNKDTHLLATLNLAHKSLEKIINSVKGWKKRIPDYFLLTALPQIVSRICHTNVESYTVIKTMLAELLVGPYGQQTFWHMISVSKNRDSTRKSRCHEIFMDAIKLKPTMEKFIKDGIR